MKTWTQYRPSKEIFTGGFNGTRMSRHASHMRVGNLPSDAPFAFEVLYQHPGDLKVNDRYRPRKSVAILGGGIAGLVAAYELAQLGHIVTVYEADDRVGGRIRTHYFRDGTYGELGAMRIPASHKCTLHYVEKFGLSLRPFVNANSAAKYFIRNRRSRLSQWHHIAKAYELSRSEICDPRTIYEQVMFKAMSLLSPQDKWEMFNNKLTSPRLRAFDDTTLHQYLARWLSADAIQYVGHATGMIQYERASFLETLIDYFGLFRVDQYEIVGGMSSLPRALAAELGKMINLSSTIQRVDINTDNQVEITYKDSSGVHSQTFDYAVCTLPAPVLARIRFNPPPPAQQVESWRRISYASSSKLILNCKERPWEFEDHIFGGGSFLDLTSQQVWYPSDNAKPDWTNVVVGYNGNDLDANEGQISTAPSAFCARDPNMSHSPGSLTAAYMWESNSRRFSAMSESERMDCALHGLRKLHSSVETQVDDAVSHSWDTASTPGAGAFAYFGPGEHQRYQPWLGRPYPSTNPRVFFAGEHLSVAHAWIQGAIQSALVATLHVLEAEPRAGRDATELNVPQRTVVGVR